VAVVSQPKRHSQSFEKIEYVILAELVPYERLHRHPDEIGIDTGARIQKTSIDVLDWIPGGVYPVHRYGAGMAL
jgi:hypothetical protein